MKPRDRRALVAGGALVALAILVLRVGPWGWRTVTQQRAQLQARAELLERMRADIRAAVRLEDSGAVVRGRLAELAPLLLSGGTNADATADLAARLAAAADHQRVRVSRKDPVADSTRHGGLGRVVLRATLESDTRGLLGFLYAVARSSAVLVIDSLRIAVADPVVSRDRPELLRTELTVRGWYQAAKDAP